MSRYTGAQLLCGSMSLVWRSSADVVKRMFSVYRLAGVCYRHSMTQRRYAAAAWWQRYCMSMEAGRPACPSQNWLHVYIAAVRAHRQSSGSRGSAVASVMKLAGRELKPQGHPARQPAHGSALVLGGADDQLLESGRILELPADQWQ